MPYQDMTKSRYIVLYHDNVKYRYFCPALIGTTYFAQILCIWAGNWYIYDWKRSLHSQIKFSNLLLKHTNIYTTQTPKGKNSKVAFRQPSFSRAHPANNNLAWQNCTQEKETFTVVKTNIYCTKQNVDQNRALETEPLGLTLRGEKKKDCCFGAEREEEASRS